VLANKRIVICYHKGRTNGAPFLFILAYTLFQTFSKNGNMTPLKVLFAALNNIFGTLYNQSLWTQLSSWVKQSMPQQIAGDINGTTFTNAVLINATIKKIWVDGSLQDPRTNPTPDGTGQLTFGTAQVGVIVVEYLSA
jgi:hypothetical protein